MEANLNQHELELFLNEYRDIMEQVDDLLPQVASGLQGQCFWSDFFVLASNLQGIAEFTDIRDLREVTRLFTDVIAAYDKGVLSFEPDHADVLAETVSALRVIFELISDGKTDQITETEVKKRLAGLLREPVLNDYTDSMSTEEADIFRSELMELTDLFSDSVERIADGDLGAEQVFNCFKATHTLKGFGDMIGCKPLHTLARELERVFFAIKEGNLDMSPRVISLSREAQIILSRITDDILSQQEQEYELAPVLDSIDRVLRNVACKKEGKRQEPVVFSLQPLSISAETEEQVRALHGQGNRTFDVIVQFSHDTQMKKVRAFQILCELQENGKIVAAEPDEKTIHDLQDDVPGLKVLYAAESKGEADIRRMVEQIITVESLIVARKEVA